jgi:threonine dehydratase
VSRIAEQSAARRIVGDIVNAVIHHEPIHLDEVAAAARRIAGETRSTPLVRFNVDTGPTEVYLKLENLQTIGSFKIRGATNALAQMTLAELADGVWTASAGNMAQALAWRARDLGIRCTVLVPEIAARAKVAAIERLGAAVIPVSTDEFFETFTTRTRAGLTGTFVHPFNDRAVMAGNGTIALEILAELPDVDAILVPYGGGGLAAGVASVVRAVARDVRVCACEPATAAPLTRSIAAGKPTESAFERTFIDGAGAARVYPEMFELVKPLLSDAFAIPVDEVKHAIALLVERNRVVAEGAGALPVAAALMGLPAAARRVVCVVSGGNIDLGVLAGILRA